MGGSIVHGEVGWVVMGGGDEVSRDVCSFSSRLAQGTQGSKNEGGEGEGGRGSVRKGRRL